MRSEREKEHVSNHVWMCISVFDKVSGILADYGCTHTEISGSFQSLKQWISRLISTMEKNDKFAPIWRIRVSNLRDWKNPRNFHVNMFCMCKCVSVSVSFYGMLSGKKNNSKKIKWIKRIELNTFKIVLYTKCFYAIINMVHWYRCLSVHAILNVELVFRFKYRKKSIAIVNFFLLCFLN